MPRVVVDDHGGTRSDPGMLGAGIYFASAARFVKNTSDIYSFEMIWFSGKTTMQNLKTTLYIPYIISQRQLEVLKDLMPLTHSNKFT